MSAATCVFVCVCFERGLELLINVARNLKLQVTRACDNSAFCDQFYNYYLSIWHYMRNDACYNIRCVHTNYFARNFNSINYLILVKINNTKNIRRSVPIDFWIFDKCNPNYRRDLLYNLAVNLFTVGLYYPY